jgi:hypothetical protein
LRDPAPQPGAPVASKLTDPGGRPPSRSGTARSSGPSGLREGGGGGSLSQKGTQRNRKGSRGRTKTTSRSHGHLRQSKCSEDDGAPRGTFRVVGGARGEHTGLRSSLASQRLWLPSVRFSGTRRPKLPSGRLLSRWPPPIVATVGLKGPSALNTVVSPSRLGMWTRRTGARNAESS